MLLSLSVLAVLGLASSGRVAQSQAIRGDSEAGAIYRRMEDAVLKCKTLQLKTTASFRTETFEAEIKASLLVKEGNRMRLEVETRGAKDGRPYYYSLFMVSDGFAIRARENQGPWRDYATSGHWNDILLRALVRGGFPSGLVVDLLKTEENPGDGAGIAFRPVPEPTEFVLWKKEEMKGHNVVPLEFKVGREAPFSNETAVILWLSERTGLPVRRMNVVLTGRTPTRVTEIYDTFLLNAAIEDSRFELPKDP